ncbi:MAG: AAA family ATPase, partial [Acidaminobacteraceae bacterium]
MKPINLKLKGLNSYTDEQEIDFESLCSKGLFGIFGPTGCGKSTILDAITIALYGAQGMARDTKDFINTETEKAVIKYVFSLKNNYGTRLYEISRSFKNSKTGVSNDMAKLLVSDASGELIEVLDKAKEVNAYLEDLLGLTADDFMRSVVLPQGKFSEFLKLKDAERRRMIERLLNLQEFGVKLADKIKRQKEYLKSKIENLDGNINALSLDNEYSIEDVEKEAKILDEKLEITNVEYKEFSIYLDKVKELYKKTNNLNDLTKKLSSFDEKLNYIDKLKGNLLKANEALQIQPIFSEMTDEKKYYKELEKNFRLVEIDFIKLEDENKILLKDYDEKTKEKEEKIPNLVNFEAKLTEMARLADENEANTKKRDDLRNEFKTLKENYDVLEKSFIDTEKLTDDTNIKIIALEKVQTENYINSDYKTMAIELRSKEDTYKGELDKLKSLIIKKSEFEIEKDKVGKEISELEPSIVDMRKKLLVSKSEYENSISEIESATKNIYESDKKLIELKSENKNYKSEIIKKEDFLKEEVKLISEKKELEKKLIIEENESEKLDIVLENLNVKYEKLRVNLILNELTSELKEGLECPLCGSENHPHIHRKVDNDKTYELDIVNNNKKSEVLRTSIMGLKKDLEFNESKFDTLGSQILNLKEFEKQIYLEKFMQEETLEMNLKSLSQNLSKLQESRVKYKAEFETTEATLEKSREILVNLNNKVQSNNVKLSECEKNIALCKSTVEELDVFRKEALAKTSFILVEDLLGDISSRESILLMTEKELKISRDLVSINQSRLKEMQIKKEDTYKTMTSIKEKGSSLSDSIKVSEKKIDEVTKNDPRLELRNVKKSIEDIKDDYQKIKEKYDLSNEKYIKLEREKIDLFTKVSISLDRIKKLSDKLEVLIKKSTFKDITEFEDSIMNEEDIKIKTSEVKSFEEEYSFLKSNISNLKDELKDQLCSKEKYDELMLKNETYIRSISELNKNLTIKITKLEQLKKNATILKAVIKEKNIFLDKQGTINEISKLTSGNKFVEFVAMNHLRYIAADASTRLIDITNGRYSLELDYNGGFVICDNYNGGVKRSCQSLSGGET